MNDGSYATSVNLLAELVPDTSSSKTCPAFSVLTTGTLWPMSFQQWPKSGSMQNGCVYERPMSERPIDVNDGSVLPTPRCSMAHGFTEKEVLEGDPFKRIETAIEVLRRETT